MTEPYRHPWPREIALSHCPRCARVSRGRQVNQEDRIPPRYCRIWGGVLEVAIFAFVRALQPLEPKE